MSWNGYAWRTPRLGTATHEPHAHASPGVVSVFLPSLPAADPSPHPAAASQSPSPPYIDGAAYTESPAHTGTRRRRLHRIVAGRSSPARHRRRRVHGIPGPCGDSPPPPTRNRRPLRGLAFAATSRHRRRRLQGAACTGHSRLSLCSTNAPATVSPKRCDILYRTRQHLQRPARPFTAPVAAAALTPKPRDHSPRRRSAYAEAAWPQCPPPPLQPAGFPPCNLRRSRWSRTNVPAACPARPLHPPTVWSLVACMPLFLQVRCLLLCLLICISINYINLYQVVGSNKCHEAIVNHEQTLHHNGSDWITPNRIALQWMISWLILFVRSWTIDFFGLCSIRVWASSVFIYHRLLKEVEYNIFV